ncbi:MAG TPA: hypothetical protein VFZ98_02560, partial [Vicinamibacterales bacterium]
IFLPDMMISLQYTPARVSIGGVIATHLLGGRHSVPIVRRARRMVPNESRLQSRYGGANPYGQRLSSLWVRSEVPSDLWRNVLDESGGRFGRQARFRYSATSARCAPAFEPASLAVLESRLKRCATLLATTRVVLR